MYKRTCPWVFCFKLDGQWTSKMVVFHSCTNRQKTMSFLEFHGQKDKIFAIFLKKFVVFRNYRQKIFQKSCFNNEILKSLFEFRSKFMLNFTHYKSKMKNVQSKLLPKLDLYIWVLLKKSMYKRTDMYKCTGWVIICWTLCMIMFA